MDTQQSVIERNIGKGSKFNIMFVAIAARMKAAGCNDDDVCLALGVHPSTIKNWKKKFPAFRLAMEDAKNANKKMLLASAYKLAVGYDWDETTRTYTYYDESDGEGGTRRVEVLKQKVVRTKHHPPNPDLLKFLVSMNNDWGGVDSDKEDNSSECPSSQLIENLGKAWLNSEDDKEVEIIDIE